MLRLENGARAWRTSWRRYVPTCAVCSSCMALSMSAESWFSCSGVRPDMVLGGKGGSSGRLRHRLPWRWHCHHHTDGDTDSKPMVRCSCKYRLCWIAVVGFGQTAPVCPPPPLPLILVRTAGRGGRRRSRAIEGDQARSSVSEAKADPLGWLVKSRLPHWVSVASKSG